MSEIAVSICMITYNHEQFIREAIEGVLMQQTDFQFELVIGEDCSNDNTRAICEEYARQYPEKIRLLASEKNLGILPNFIRTLVACQGKYVAVCEGDDFWTDPLKLQKQVDFLEAHPQFSACAHRVSISYEDKFDREIFFHNDDIKDFETLLQHFYPTCSLVFKKSCLDEKAIQLLTSTPIVGGDKLLMMILFKHGRLKFLDLEMATYRKHRGGASYTVDFEKMYSNSIRFYKAVNNYFIKKYSSIIRRNLLINYGNLSLYYREKSQLFSACKNLFFAFIYIRSQSDLKIFVADYVLKFLKRQKIQPGNI